MSYPPDEVLQLRRLKLKNVPSHQPPRRPWVLAWVLTGIIGYMLLVAGVFGPMMSSKDNEATTYEEPDDGFYEVAYVEAVNDQFPQVDAFDVIEGFRSYCTGSPERVAVALRTANNEYMNEFMHILEAACPEQARQVQANL
jgi:hypothetical protein